MSHKLFPTLDSTGHLARLCHCVGAPNPNTWLRTLMQKTIRKCSWNKNSCYWGGKRPTEFKQRWKSAGFVPSRLPTPSPTFGPFGPLAPGRFSDWLLKVSTLTWQFINPTRPAANPQDTQGPAVLPGKGPASGQLSQVDWLTGHLRTLVWLFMECGKVVLQFFWKRGKK